MPDPRRAVLDLLVHDLLHERYGITLDRLTAERARPDPLRPWTLQEQIRHWRTLADALDQDGTHG